MAFELYSEVILTRDVAEEGLRAGDVGTVVERHAAPGAGDEGYSARGQGKVAAPTPTRLPKRHVSSALPAPATSTLDLAGLAQAL